MNPPDFITVLPNGQWVLREDSHISRWAEQHGSIVCDPHTMRFLNPFLERSKVAWDIGAFIGDHTRHYIDKGLTVVAVEPNPLAYACLRHNCPEAQCLNVGASVAHEILKYQASPNAGASRVCEDGEMEISAMPLDRVEGLPDPDFLKIDIEGFELCALLGMRKMIERCKPTCYVEINVGALALNHVVPEDIFQFFRDRGYKHFDKRPASASWDSPQYDVLISA